MKIFYQQSAVQTVLHPDGDTTLLRARDTPLAEHCSSARSQSLVLGCDQQGSPLSVMSANASRTGRYTPYGLETTLPSATGFTGQLKAWSLPGYFLGSGYRFFNTVLMRFHSPDSFSPFAAGGINAYMYCAGDPVNRIDPSGHMQIFSTGRPRSPLRVGYDYTVDGPTPHRLRVAPYPSNRPGAAVIASSSSSTVATVSAGSSSSTVTTVSAGSSRHAVATVIATSSSSAGSTGSATVTKNSQNTVNLKRLFLTNPEVQEKFHKWIQTAELIAGLDYQKTQLALTTAFDAIRKGTKLTQSVRDQIGVHVYEMNNATSRVHYWIGAEMGRAGNNNFFN